MNDYHTYDFPDHKCLIVCGDIHGDFNLLVNKICVQYELKDTVVIVAGDCGFGFERKGYYDNIVKRNAKRMNEANNWLIFIRGNHDNPAYFDVLQMFAFSFFEGSHICRFLPILRPPPSPSESL